MGALDFPGAMMTSTALLLSSDLEGAVAGSMEKKAAQTHDALPLYPAFIKSSLESLSLSFVEEYNSGRPEMSRPLSYIHSC